MKGPSTDAAAAAFGNAGVGGARRSVVAGADTDGQLMARVREGDDEAFARLVDRYRDPLVNYLTRMVRCRDRAEEYAQEAFVRLYRHRRGYREQGHLAGYLYRIATNLLRSDERRAARWRGLAPVYRAGQPAASGSPQRELLGDEASRQVARALAQLPVLYRAPVVLREIEGWSYAEIAATLGCREGTVKSRISRGRERLRRLLEPYWQETRE